MLSSTFSTLRSRLPRSRAPIYNFGMPQKKPKHQSWDSFIEQRIREAQDAGEFDNLPGMGEKCPLIEEPYEELWWVKRLMRREQLSSLPVSLEIRKAVAEQMQRILQLTAEEDVRQAVDRLNKKIRDANYRSVSGPPSSTALLDADWVVSQWRTVPREPL